MKATIIRSCCFTLLSLLGAAPVLADGTITHLSGAVSVLKKDGTTILGVAGAKVMEGDVMVTGADGFGRLELTDGGEMVLRPNSQLKIERYRFHAEKPSEDGFAFRMLKGGLRTVTGLIGKRGDPNAYVGTTATATIGIRGTQFDLRLCQGDCGSLSDGTYLAVRFGAVRTGNPQGSIDVAAGQVALVQAAKLPVMLPRDPGIGFTPPAVIPKLDEKKKVQAAAAAAPAPAQAKPAAGAATQATPAQAKPAAASSPASASASTSSGGTASAGGNAAPATAAEAAPAAAQQAPSQAPASAQPGPASEASPAATPAPASAASPSAPGTAAPAIPAPAGVECSVQ